MATKQASRLAANTNSNAKANKRNDIGLVIIQYKIKYSPISIPLEFIEEYGIAYGIPEKKKNKKKAQQCSPKRKTKFQFIKIFYIF